ncbi:hypothetical protein F4808DRAFT_429840 [Astrocystis sublimbata]|nr:hypothetical protein F4808DRAFT_429840 [Astrocystis sublimbata]
MPTSFHFKLYSLLVVIASIIAALIIRPNPSVDHQMSGNTVGETDDCDLVVTPENPAREDGTLDYIRCAALHKCLVQKVLDAEGKRLEEIEGGSFFQHYGHAADEIRDRLSPSLAAFLESIFISDELPPFFFWVDSISHPSHLFFHDDLLNDDGEMPHRVVTLYMTNLGLGGGHTMGLLYDQKLHRATMTLDLEDGEFVLPAEMHGELWHPLETVLSNWIHMVKIGKITASQDEAPNEKYGPWTWQPYGESQVHTTVAAFERLVDAIEERMPIEQSVEPRQERLLSHEHLSEAGVPDNCFIRSILTQIRRPRFKMIAPGLEVPHDPVAFANNQKFTTMNFESKYGAVIPPVLIFASAERRVVDLDPPDRYTAFNPFCKAFKDGVPPGDRSIVAGLYSESVERFAVDVAEEGFRLLLPFRFRDLGLDNGAKKSDGNQVEKGSVADLFQHGFKPFGGEWWRAQRLEALLDHWRYLVETGVWMVGPEGVQGSIDKFRNAGMDESDDYVIKPSW